MKNFSYIKSFLFFIILSLSVITLTSCGGGTSDDGTPIRAKIDISGLVSGSGPLADVNVSAGNISTKTDINGAYLLEDVPVPDSKRIVVSYEKEGYGTYQRSLVAEGGETYAVEAKLLRYQLSESINNGTQAQTLSASDNAGTLVSLTLDTGSLNEDDVVVNIATGDPTTDAGRAVFPGDYMAATTAGGEPNTPLESIAYTEITIVNAQGDELANLDKPATLKVRLPDIYQTGGLKAGTYIAGHADKGFIPWWSYDENNGTWIEEDADPATPTKDKATVIDEAGILYAQAKVTHFSWWNADQPISEHACLCLKVVDENGDPIKDALVIANGVTYDGRSTPRKTDALGRVCLTIKRTTVPATPEMVKIHVEYGGVNFYYDVTNADEGDVANDLIKTPEEQGSTITVPTTGTCKDLENNLVVSFQGTVSGKVTYEGGAPVAGFTLHSNFGSTATTDTQGNYTIKTPLDVEVMLFAPGLTSKTITTTQGEPEKILDFVISNRAPVINSLTRNPTGLINHGGTVTLDVQASDPDGDTVSYSWSVSGQGSLNKTTGTQVIWTAPGSGINDDLVTVTVTDSKGKQTSQTITINWGGSTGGTAFKLTVKDNRLNNQPMSGVTVAVYNVDNQSIQSTKSTNAQGVADFGDVGRNHASITIAFEGSGLSFQKVIDTFVNIPLGDYVYYTEDNYDSFCSSPIANINISVPGIPAASGYTQVQPTTTLIGKANPTSPAFVCSQHLQADGKLSLLAASYESYTSPQILKYGFLLNQTVTNGNTYEIDLNNSSIGRLPNATQISSSGASPDQAYVFGYIGKVMYDVGTNIALTPTNNTVLVANEFPVDFFTVTAQKGSTDAMVSINKRYNTLPQSAQLNLPDYSLGNPNYSQSTNTLSWTLSGTSPHDFVSIDMLGIESVSGITRWSVFLPNGTTSWKGMPLPAPVNTWVDSSNLGNSFYYADLEVIDLDFVTGSDEFIQFAATGGDYLESSNQQLAATAYIPFLPQLAKPAKKVASEKQEHSINTFSPIKGAIGGFMRR